MDPVTALAAATTAFNVIKKGFEVGRDLESMAGDIGRWMSAVNTVKDAEQEARNPPLFKKLVFAKSAEEEAMQLFMAKKKTEDMRSQLREIIIYTRGMNAWQELLTMEGDIRKQRQQALDNQKKARKDFFEKIAISILILCGLGLAIWFFWFITVAVESRQAGV